MLNGPPHDGLPSLYLLVTETGLLIPIGTVPNFTLCHCILSYSVVHYFD